MSIFRIARRSAFPLFLIVTSLVSLHECTALELALETEIQLPGDGPWDVQHWVSDTTYGWAQILGDTLYFVERIGEQTATVPLVTGDGWYVTRPPHFGVKCLMEVDSTPAVAVGFSMADQWGNYFGWSIRRWQVEDSQFAPGMTMVFDDAPSDDNITNGPHFLDVWPHPPAPTRYVAFLTDYIRDHWGTGNGSITNAASGRLIDLATGATALELADVRALSIFERADQPDLGYSTYWSICWIGPDYDTFREFSSVMRSHVGYADIVLASCSSFDGDANCYGGQSHHCGATSVIAQVDSGGASRLLSLGTCFDAVSDTILWVSDELRGLTFSGSVHGSPNERFLNWNVSDDGGCFNIIDASSGGTIDTTNLIAGQPQYLLKQPNRPAEVVTYDASSRIARVYKQVREVRGLVIQAFGELGELRLSWEPVPTAYRYSIFSSPSENGPWSWVVTIDVDEPEFWQILNPTATRQFYTVTAKY